MTIAVAIMFLILGNDPQYKCVPAEKKKDAPCNCNNTLQHKETFDPDAIRARYVELSKDVPYDPKKSRKRSRRTLTWFEEMYREYRDYQNDGVGDEGTPGEEM